MIRTAGGTFDRNDRPIYFAAGSASAYPRHVLVAVNDLLTPSSERHLEQLLDAGHTVLLDSGIFWLTNEHMRATGCSMDEALALPPEQIRNFDNLYARYVDLTTRYGDRLWGYIELDQGGAAAKRRTRARLHDLGLRPIPVYHPLVDGWDYFDELAEGYDRICYGNVVQAKQALRVRLLHTLWERHRAHPDLWVHVLGLTANEWCLPMPPDSCDSSSWVNPLRYPKARLASAALRVFGECGPAYRYDLADPQHPDRGRDPACALYADLVTVHNQLWHTARNANAEHLGDVDYPPRHDQEGPCAPC